MAKPEGLRERACLRGRRLMRVFRVDGAEGSALLETAIALPLLLAVIMGASSFSMAFYELQELGNAASGAAQELGATAGTVADPCAQVVLQVKAALPNLNPSNLTFTVTTTDSSGTATVTSGGTGISCTSAGDGGKDPEAANEPQTVQISYAYPWMPVFTYGTIFTFKTPTTKLTASSTTMGE